MNACKRFWGHLRTITRHRHMVIRHCAKAGILWQGLRHDLSKYGPTEFWQGVRFFDGTHSPTEDERRTLGYSVAWMHHKGRNRHHWEYWTDCKKGVGLVAVEMPLKYTAEMCCDRIAACRVYHGKNYKQGDALEYFLQGRVAPAMMHEKTAEKLRQWLELVRDEGEERAFAVIKQELKNS